MRLVHLDTGVWLKLLDRAQAAAVRGESSFELIRFPWDLCSDGVAKSTLPKLTGRRPLGAKRPRSMRGGNASFDRRGSGFAPKLSNIWRASQTTSPYRSPGPLLKSAEMNGRLYDLRIKSSTSLNSWAAR